MIVRSPASSANLGAGFDVLGLAVDLFADVGTGDAPEGAAQLDQHHPGRVAFEALGGEGPIWLRCAIPMARGLGFSGAVRVAAASLAAIQVEAGPNTSGAAATGDPESITAAAELIEQRAPDILEVSARLEGHGDNVAASLRGGVTAYVDGSAIPVPVGSRLGSTAVVAWIPDVTTSTDRSRRTLAATVERSAAVHNIGAAVQFALAFAHDDPTLLAGATDDRLHQADRVPMVDGAAEALEAGVAAGAWCGWLSGSGPTVAFLAAPDLASAVADSLPTSGHTKILGIDRAGTRPIAG